MLDRQEKNLPYRLSAGQAARSRNFLDQLDDLNASTGDALLALFARICLAHISEDAKHHEINDRVDGFASSIIDRPGNSQTAIDPLLIMCLQDGYRRLGFSSDSLNTIIDKLAVETGALPRKIRESGRLRLTTSMLERSGHPLRPSPVPIRFRPQNIRPERVLRGSDEFLAELADHLLATSQPLDEDLSWPLSLVALSVLRNYRIDLACRILRALIACGADNALIHDALQFIAVQRCSDGGYGFTNPFSETIGDPADQERGFRLPVTANALWLFDQARMLASDKCVALSPQRLG
jgi:hypothetical protein